MTKAIARTAIMTIIWSLMLALVASALTYVFFGIVAEDAWALVHLVGHLPVFVAFGTALTGGLVAFPFYFYVRTKVTGIDHTLNIASWTLALTILGGIAVFSIGALIAFVSSMITFTAYELSKRVRFVRKKQGKGYRLVRL